MISIYNDAPMIYACHCNISDGGGNNEEVDDIDDDKMMITIENIWTDMTDMTLMMVVVVIMMVMMIKLIDTVCSHSPYPRSLWPLQVQPVKQFRTKKSNSETTKTGRTNAKKSLIFNAKYKTKSMYGSDVLALLRQA